MQQHVWVGQELIESIQAPVIEFKDLRVVRNLLSESDTQGRQRVVCCTEVGRGLHQIANDESLEVAEQLQKMAGEWVRLLARACLDSSDPRRYYAAGHPLPPTARSIGGLFNSTEYPIAVVARVKEWRGGQWSSLALAVRLNRIAAWVAQGDPGNTRPLATHRCGNKTCLAPRCLRWGSYKENVWESMEGAYRRERDDPDYEPRM